MLVEYRFFCSSLLLGRLNVFKCLHIFCCDFWIGIYYQCFLCKVRQKKPFCIRITKHIYFIRLSTSKLLSANVGKIMAKATKLDQSDAFCGLLRFFCVPARCSVFCATEIL